MLPLENRLKKLRDFNLLMKYGRWITGVNVDVRFVTLARLNETVLPKRVEPTEFVGQLKFAFGVGTKFSKRAVVRNKVRRKLREVIRLLLKKPGIVSGQFILLVPKKPLIEAPYQQIEQEVKTLLARARLLKGE
jgi:ribonuclease P protein component